MLIIQLKKECVRNLLLYLEENLSYENNIQVNYIPLKQYKKIKLFIPVIN